MYTVFTHDWWKKNSTTGKYEAWGGAPKTTLAKNIHTLEEAQQIAQDYNVSNLVTHVIVEGIGKCRNRCAEFEEQ